MIAHSPPGARRLAWASLGQESVRSAWHVAVKLVSAFVRGRIPSRQGVSWMSEASFDRVISEHLALTERNRRLEPRMPLDGYREQVGGRSTASPSPEEETIARDGQAHWLETDPVWDTTGQRSVPEFDWGDD